jgi:hypothetical protein
MRDENSLKDLPLDLLLKFRSKAPRRLTPSLKSLLVQSYLRLNVNGTRLAQSLKEAKPQSQTTSRRTALKQDDTPGLKALRSRQPSASLRSNFSPNLSKRKNEEGAEEVGS